MGGRPAAGEKEVENATPALRSSVLEVAAIKMAIVSILCLPYGLITEGAEPWTRLFSNQFWTSGPQGVLLAISAAITASFQLCNVGLSSETGSVALSLVS